MDVEQNRSKPNRSALSDQVPFFSRNRSKPNRAQPYLIELHVNAFSISSPHLDGFGFSRLQRASRLTHSYTEESFAGSLELASVKFPCLIGNSAFIGRVTDVQDDPKSRKIWLSEPSMVSLPCLKSRLSDGFPLSSLADECARRFGIDSCGQLTDDAGNYFALATIFPSSKVCHLPTNVWRYLVILSVPWSTLFQWPLVKLEIPKVNWEDVGGKESDSVSDRVISHLLVELDG
ncbi:PREDICTED: calmodulin-interacting 111 [Prunus dulcis]|uniref:PREDICTED: calmodulin-interacting 111 n=1 Tax=Prunus dulcis TaxID=3755 RepID=A0A5E4ET64_PRUDU|nr:hypothetical protein L3X38_016280 [Prunus dulcis]VVA18672.1 PREDICTED: calmodulin-interacting 111 [Prunus dulcis]